MLLHVGFDGLRYGKNGRFVHCFGDEDGMQWLKRAWAHTQSKS